MVGDCGMIPLEVKEAVYGGEDFIKYKRLMNYIM